MDPSKALRRTKTLTGIAIGAAIAMPCAFAAFDSLVAWLSLPVLAVVQITFGIIACVVGRRAARRAEQLGIGAPLAEVKQLHDWSGVALVVAVLGIVGLVLVFLFSLLLLAGAMGGAWGRPLRIDGKNVGAALGNGSRWARGPRPDIGALDPTTREALGRMWLHDAIKEHGSVPAFAQVTWDLAALGAPAELLERAQTSARQEIEHARLCFAVSETYLGKTIGIGPIAQATGGNRRRAGVIRCAQRLALETLEDGCLIEDLNADFAARAHALATDPAMRSLTDIIAREEREHADLAWDILRFCVELHPDVATAVRRRLAKLPDHILVPYDLESAAIIARADEAGLGAHGRVPFGEWTSIYLARREATIRRAHALLDELGPVARDRRRLRSPTIASSANAPVAGAPLAHPQP
jgi:hypothetical protein